MSQLEKKYMLYFELHTKYKDDCCNKKINTISYVSIGFLDIYDDEQELDGEIKEIMTL